MMMAMNPLFHPRKVGVSVVNFTLAMKIYTAIIAQGLSLSVLRVMIQNVVLVESERFILIDLSLSAFAARGLLSDDDPS